MVKWLKRIFWVLVLVAIIGGIAWSFRPQPIVVDTTSVLQGALEVTINEDGKTRIKEKYIVSTPVGGRLQRITFREGDSVLATSTVIASIQPSNPNLLDARTLAQAKARVSAAKSALDRAKSKVAQTQIDKDQAEKEYEQARELIQTQAISQQEFDLKNSKFRSCTELLRSANFDRDIASYELELAEAAMIHVQPDNSEQRDSGFFAIRSPIQGVVLRVLQESSTIVSAGTPIMELGDATDLEIVVDLLSSDAVKVGPGTKVHIEQWGGDKPLTGVVRLIEPSAFEKISALGVEEQRVNVIIDFEIPESQMGRIGDGYRIEARLVTWQNDSIVKVSTSALFRENNRWAVFVVSEGVAKLTYVEIGHRNDQEAEIMGGLKAGQTVIMHPGDSITDGSMVQARESDDENKVEE